MVDALCVGAHPDDVEIGMGGTVGGMVRGGMSVAIVDLTDGEPTSRGTREKRLLESRAAASILGVDDRRTLPLKNRELSDTTEARYLLAEIMRDLRPTVLFAPYPEDAHPDHVAASDIVEAARFYAKFTKTHMAGEPHFPPRLYHYYALHLRSSPDPSFCVDVTEDLMTKIEAVTCYETQFVANAADEGVLQTLERVTAYWGGLVGCTHAEPFFSREEIGVRSVSDLL